MEMTMTPERLRGLQAAINAADWDWSRSPRYRIPIRPRMADYRIPSEEECLKPAEPPYVEFEVKRGLIVTDDILRPEPGCWIEAEGHIILAFIKDKDGLTRFPRIEGDKA